MNKQLEKLCLIYSDADVDSYTKTSMFSMLCKIRNKAYNLAFKEENSDELQESIIDESIAFSSFLAAVAINPKLSKGTFDDVMTIVANMNKTTFSSLHEDLQFQVLEGEIASIKDVLKTLKQNPHKVGIKIKSVRFALNSLIDERDNLLDKWRSERKQEEFSDENPTL